MAYDTMSVVSGMVNDVAANFSGHSSCFPLVSKCQWLNGYSAMILLSIPKTSSRYNCQIGKKKQPVTCVFAAIKIKENL
jgi:hypothetical protein